MIPRGLDHLFDALFVANIAGVDPQAGRPCLCRLNTALLMEMNIRHDRHRNLRHDQFQRCT